MRSRVAATRPPPFRATARDEGPEADDFFVRASDLCESSSERGTFGDSGAASRVRLPRTFGAHAGNNCLAGRVRSVVRQLLPRVQMALPSIFFFNTSKVFLDALRRLSIRLAVKFTRRWRRRGDASAYGGGPPDLGVSREAERRLSRRANNTVLAAVRH